MVLRGIPCLTIRFCHLLHVFVSQNRVAFGRLRALRTKSDLRKTTCTVKHRVDIQADQNFRTKMLESKKRTKPDNKANSAQRYSEMIKAYCNRQQVYQQSSVIPNKSESTKKCSQKAFRCGTAI